MSNESYREYRITMSRAAYQTFKQPRNLLNRDNIISGIIWFTIHQIGIVVILSDEEVMIMKLAIPNLDVTETLRHRIGDSDPF